MNEAKLIGDYQCTPTGIKKNDATLVIGHRKVPTPSKPKDYLLLKLPAGRFQYVSSLYRSIQDTGSTIYTFDYEGAGYRLELDTTAGKAKIQKADGRG